MKGKIVGGIIAASVSVAIVFVYANFQEIPDNNDEDPFKNWIISGPFKLLKFEHKIGESIFLSIGDLTPQESGNILVILPRGDVYQTIPFDGSKKSSFNRYFTLDLSRALKICDVEDLIGTWKLVFDGVNYKEITFEVIDEYLQGEQKHYESVC